MITRIFLFALIAAAFSGCLRNDVEDGTPDCIIGKIREHKKQGCDDQKVEQYQFQGKYVFVFGPGTCGADMQSDVYDENCNLLGSLGGITGNMSINGADFSSAVFVSLVWEQ